MVREHLAPSQLRIKVLAPLITGAAFAVLLLQDWGEGTVFSGIRPALKSVLNRAIGPQQSHSSSDSATGPPES